jgi:hypothetical protein
MLGRYFDMGRIIDRTIGKLATEKPRPIAASGDVSK